MLLFSLVKYATTSGHSELGSESSAFDFQIFLKALDAETSSA